MKDYFELLKLSKTANGKRPIKIVFQVSLLGGIAFFTLTNNGIVGNFNFKEQLPQETAVVIEATTEEADVSSNGTKEQTIKKEDASKKYPYVEEERDSPIQISSEKEKIEVPSRVETEKKDTIIVPNVTNLASIEATRAIKQSGIDSVQVESRPSNTERGIVFAQSIVAGQSIEDNGLSEITLFVSEGNPVFTSWTSDSTYMTNPYYNTQQRTLYQTATRNKSERIFETTEASFPNCELINTKTEYVSGDWSEYSDNYIEPTVTREVETKIVDIGYITQICLSRYYSVTKNNFSDRLLDNSYKEETGWFNLSDIKGPFQAFTGGRTDCYEVPDWNYFFFEIGPEGGKTREISAGTKKQYRYRDKREIKTYTYKEIVFSEWSTPVWTEIKPLENDVTKIIETKQEYLYSLK